MSTETTGPEVNDQSFDPETGLQRIERATTAGPSADQVIQLPAADVREKALPIRPGDLTRLLMSQPDLSAEEREGLGQFGRMLGATFHSEFYERLRELKESYGALDPDSDYVSLPAYSPACTADPSDGFLNLFESTLDRANYHILSLDIVRAAIEAPNELGLNYVPDLTLFEHLRIYVRGYTRITRESRTVKSRFQKRMVTLDAYQRLIVALKFKDGVKRAGPHVRTDVLYLRMFKDVPHVDMEMHLPEQGTKVRMRLMDKAQIASPLAVGIPSMLLKALGLISAGGIAGLVVAPISAGVNSFFGFQRAKQKHLTHMIRSLYYMTLANNASVLTRLIDSAEEEEYKETLLSYFFLWRSLYHRGENWDQQQLDLAIEDFLRKETGVEINFEIKDALGKLFRLGLAKRDSEGRIRPKPIDEALAHLDRLWDNTFQFKQTKVPDHSQITEL